MKTIYTIKLPTIQIVWFAEICRELGIKILNQKENLITTFCELEELQIAWELFVEDFKRKILL